ncbi:hypothetical protein [Paraburkholderia fungorum]|uniref:hypothetical protein n=1 Tax=Paraburkholderia fungorum TaxID=134537 RepID=UPI0038BC59FA
MSTQPILGHSFPTPCKRCGGALYRQVDYCPYCGEVHPLDPAPYKRVGTPGSRTSATSKATPKSSAEPTPSAESDLTVRAEQASEAAPAREAVHTQMLASADMPVAPVAGHAAHGRGRGSLSTRKVVTGIGAIVVIGLAYGVYTLVSDNGDSQSSNSDQSADTAQDTRTTTGTVAPYSPAQPATQTATANPAAPARPGNPAKAAAPAISVTPIAPPASTAPSTPAAAPRFRDAAQAMQAARLAFRVNDLSTAQAALGAAQTLQPGNADAQALSGDLRPLAARRDSALQAAQACVAQQSWTCARQHANDALSIDTGNATAKTILERVIRETGWAPLNSHAATGSNPAQPKLQPQTQTTLQSQQAQLQPPLPSGLPANGAAMAAAPHTVPAAGDPASIEARERAIKDSGWTRAPSNRARSSASAPPGQ